MTIIDKVELGVKNIQNVDGKPYFEVASWFLGVPGPDRKGKAIAIYVFSLKKEKDTFYSFI